MQKRVAQQLDLPIQIVPINRQSALFVRNSTKKDRQIGDLVISAAY